MAGFKLISIIPLKGCHKKYRKKLNIGEVYRFYNSYKIELNQEKSKIVTVEKLPNKIPENLYQLRNGINVNFSAVVGENGSGKSALFELMYYFIYLLGIEIKINDNQLISLYSKYLEEYRFELQNDAEKLQDKINSNTEQNESYSESAEFLCENLKNKHQIDVFPKSNWTNLQYCDKVVTELLYKVAVQDLLIKDEKDIEEHIKNNINLSVIYEVDGEIRELTHYGGGFVYYIYKNKEKEEINNKLNLSDLFYTISINYSHHGLNSKIIGNWINKLFHKNDGYATPIVINPMRNEGVFDINSEIKLSKERLMSNLIFDLFNNKDALILGKYRVSKFKFTPKTVFFKKKVKIEPLGFDEEYFSNVEYGLLLKELIDLDKIDDNIDYWDYAFSYLKDKFNRLKRNYPNLIYNSEFGSSNEEQFNFFIKKDKSHVTKKVRQVINFLKMTYKKENRDFWKIPDSTIQIEKDSTEMIEWIKKFDLDLINVSPADLIEVALPGFFAIDFILEDLDRNTLEFGELSSGEQQMILNVNSILYHLYNLQSSFNNNNVTGSRVSYKRINILLDEIELYYHPNMQRLFVQNLMDSFEFIKNKDEIGLDSINVCFLTHSPYILSDIPKENVLKIKDGNVISKKHEKNTFASNINDLLSNDFFMETLTGKFSENRISLVIDNITNGNFSKEDREIVNLIGDSFLKSSIERYIETRND